MTKFKENRPFCFIAIALIYIFSSALGVAVYRLLPFDMWLSLLI